MSELYGFIGEDISDYDTFKEILIKFNTSKKFSMKKFLGRGHGKIQSKMHAWTKDLIQDGCKLIFIVQDLDQNDLEKLRSSIENKIKSLNKKKNIVVVIPVIELEAWLLTDPEVLKKVFNLTQVPKTPINPESLKDPKKEIANVVRSFRKNKGLVYVNTSHNKEIARELTKDSLLKCKSFQKLSAVLEGHFGATKKTK